MKHWQKYIFSVAGGLAVALALRVILANLRHELDMVETFGNLRAIHRGVAMYLSDNDGTAGFESRQPELGDLLPRYVTRDKFTSPCWWVPHPTTTYWTKLGTDSDSVVLASNISCSDRQAWNDKLGQKHGLGITRAGSLIDITAFGDPEDFRWWTDPGSRL